MIASAASVTHDVASESILDPRTAMDAVTLRVGDIAAMSSYYSHALGLEPLEERARGREVHRALGRGNTPMIRLIETPDLPPVDPRQAGLFHTAFLFDEPSTLAATARSSTSARCTASSARE